MAVSRLDIRNKCLSVKQNDGCLFIKEQTGELGYEHILCVSGDERVLADAFDEYLATDVFSHYVKCRDINVLRNAQNAFTTDDVLGLEFNFINTDPGETTTLVMTTDDQTASIEAKVAGTVDTPVFEFGDGNNTIQFTEAETKRVKIGDYWYQVTFIEFKTAVFTIDRVEKFLFPEGSIAVMDELTSEIVYENTDVQHVPTVIARIDELMGEIVYEHDDIPVQSTIYKLMIDELVGELVYEDDSLSLIPPHNITVCDVPDSLAPPSSVPETGTPSTSTTLTDECHQPCGDYVDNGKYTHGSYCSRFGGPGPKASDDGTLFVHRVGRNSQGSDIGLMINEYINDTWVMTQELHGAQYDFYRYHPSGDGSTIMIEMARGSEKHAYKKNSSGVWEHQTTLTVTTGPSQANGWYTHSDAINNDGTVYAFVNIPYDGNTTANRGWSVYHLVNGTWQLKGTPMLGYDSTDATSYRPDGLMAMDATGDVIVTGIKVMTPYRVYYFDGSDWQQSGNDLSLPNYNKREVKMSGDGKTFIISDDSADINGLTNNGKIWTYKLTGDHATGSWSLVNDMTGNVNSQRLGDFINITHDGNRMSSYVYDGTTRIIRVFDWNQSTNTWDVAHDFDTAPVLSSTGNGFWDPEHYMTPDGTKFYIESDQWSSNTSGTSVKRSICIRNISPAATTTNLWIDTETWNDTETWYD